MVCCPFDSFGNQSDYLELKKFVNWLIMKEKWLILMWQI
jgi:hypothetical protein